MTNTNDFSRGSVSRHIVALAGPMILAQFINLLYNMVDRIYIGRLGRHATEAMSALGVCLPAITIGIAFANLVGMGGSPLVSIARGKKDLDLARRILANALVYLVFLSVLLMGGGLLFCKPLLIGFGASSSTIAYAQTYLSIYLLGTPFVLIALGMNAFINAQGFAKTGMMTVVIGAILNIVLDPILIFGCGLGVAGAAIATIVSQAVSMAWTLRFLTSSRSIVRLEWNRLSVDFSIVG